MVAMDKNWQEVLDKNRMVFLLDTYGGLLTDKARETLSLYLNEDWSITEIGDELGVSRQAVHDSLQRGLEHLERFEEQLGIASTNEKLRSKLRALEQLLEDGRLSEAKVLVHELETGL